MNSNLLVIILFVLSWNAFGQFEPNQDSVLYYFQNLMNQYRIDIGVKPIVVDKRWEAFAKKHSEYMASRYPAPPISSYKVLGEGNWENFGRYIEEVLGYDGWFFENVGAFRIFEKNDVQKFKRVTDTNHAFYKYYSEMFKNGPTDKLLAGITFEYWKNELSGDCSFNMRNQDLEGFYLSVSIAGDKFYVEFVAFDYL